MGCTSSTLLKALTKTHAKREVEKKRSRSSEESCFRCLTSALPFRPSNHFASLESLSNATATNSILVAEAMAQHPDKLRWKEEHPYGLSASQFGMALGFRGRISDYVHYLRNIVGTEKEFKGNEFTAHGIATEPKSRSLYELLTGCQVHNGGFFVTADGVLGCSPDGQVFYPAEEKPIEKQSRLDNPSPMAASEATSTTTLNSGDGALHLVDQPRRSGRCSVHVPFKSRQRARSPLSATTLHSPTSFSAFPGPSTSRHLGSTTAGSLSSSLTATRASLAKVESLLSPAANTGTVAAASKSFSQQPTFRQRVRLLEIKSPFRALYDSIKPDCEPFGIPQYYMCQVQGQLAIADSEECDFFVYLDHPVCQVEAWRVRRSREFWQWAEPALRQVSEWVKNGPPDWLNRAFAFPPFDFRRIEVVPLVFPYDITAAAALTDARRFSFFAKYPSPYEALLRHREARGSFDNGDGLRLSGGSGFSSISSRVQQWCQDYCGTSWADLTEYERIALAVQTPVVRFLFDTKRNSSSADAAIGDTVGDENKGRGDSLFCQTLSTWRCVLESCGSYENSSTARLCRSLLCTASSDRDPFMQFDVAIPEDWEEGRITVQCIVPSLRVATTPNGVSKIDTFSDITSFGFFHRLFLVSLIPLQGHKCTAEGGVAGALF